MVDRKYEYGDPVEDAASREFGCSGGETLPDEVFEEFESEDDRMDANVSAIFDQIFAEDDDPVI